MSSQQHSQAGASRRIASYNFMSGSGVATAELREDTAPVTDDASKPETRSFSLIDGKAGSEWLSIILNRIDNDRAQVAIEDLSQDETRLRAIPLGDVMQNVLYTGGVHTAIFDPEGSNIELDVLGPAGAGFVPTEEPGQYVVAA